MFFNNDFEFEDIEFTLIEQKFPDSKIKDVHLELFKELDQLNLSNKIKPGMSIGITAGSRGISNIDLITKSTCDYFKILGAKPFIIPAMGSHGGATAQGQKELLGELGITEDTMGCPIKSSMDVVMIGHTESGVPVYMDKYANEADGVIVINRVKPHTDFEHNIESGLSKMIAVGLGKHKGCATMHANGLRRSIPESARLSLEKMNIICGIGIVENSKDETYMIKAVLPQYFQEVEMELLKVAKSTVPKLPIKELDLLVVYEMGKMISGTGMDTKVLGRIRIDGEEEPKLPAINKIVTLNLASNSHGNALGIGLADITTKKLVDSMDLDATYANTLATTFLERAKIPITMRTDKEAIQAAVSTLSNVGKDTVKIAVIKNTLDLEKLYLSKGALESLRDDTEITPLKDKVKLTFDNNEEINIFELLE